MKPLHRAVKMVGGPSELARRIGVTPQFLSQMLSGNRPIPARRVIAIEQATLDSITGLPLVTRYELAPDIYPRQNGQAA